MKKNKTLMLPIVGSIVASIPFLSMISCGSIELDDVTNGFNPTYDQYANVPLDYKTANNEYFAFIKNNPDFVNQEYKYYSGEIAKAIKQGYYQNVLESFKTKLTNFKIVDESKHIVSYQINKQIEYVYYTNETKCKVITTSVINVNNLELNVFVSNKQSQVDKINGNALQWFVSPSALNCDLNNNNWSFSNKTTVKKDYYI